MGGCRGKHGYQFYDNMNVAIYYGEDPSCKGTVATGGSKGCVAPNPTEKEVPFSD